MIVAGTQCIKAVRSALALFRACVLHNARMQRKATDSDAPMVIIQAIQKAGYSRCMYPLPFCI